MSDTVKNVLAVVVGIAVGMAVNMGIIRISGSLIPLPDGVDATTMEGLKKGIHLFQPKHYLMPFLAHALGTFAGAALAVLLAASSTSSLRWDLGSSFCLVASPTR